MATSNLLLITKVACRQTGGPRYAKIRVDPLALSDTPMLRCGRHIRLTRTEVARFTEITRFEPVEVRTLDDLEAFIAECKRYYWGHSRETRFLHWLMDREYARCLGDAAD